MTHSTIDYLTDAQDRSMHDDAVQAARDAYSAIVTFETKLAAAAGALGEALGDPLAAALALPYIVDMPAERESCAYCGSGPAWYERRGDLYLCRACGRLD